LKVNLLGLGLILLTALLLLVWTRLPAARRRLSFRQLPAFQQLRQAIGLAVEGGKRLHVSLGSAGLLTTENASGLVGLSVLRRIAEISIISDRPPLATSGDGAMALLSQNALHAAYETVKAEELYDPDRGRLTGVTPAAFIAGTIPVMRSEQISANLLVGNFGPEAVLLCDTAGQEESFLLAATDSLPAQAALYAAAQEPLIGEELFAIPAYLQAGPVFSASLRVQDILRWLLITALLGAAIVKLLLETGGMVLP